MVSDDKALSWKAQEEAEGRSATGLADLITLPACKSY
jgi:hypothetical protein